MREIEIIDPPVLDKQKERITDLHSLLNILNIISLQVGELCMDFPQFNDRLAHLEQRIDDLANAFKSEDDLAPLVEQLRYTEDLVLHKLKEISEQTYEKEEAAKVKAVRENFECIYKILHVRLDEFAERLENPDVWISISSASLSQQISDVFSAIEKNANGRYYIRFNLALKEKGEVLFEYDISSEVLINNRQFNRRMVVKRTIFD